ncbi:hypothetical protein M3Y97_00491200 [Aphelenchoides bicaudatus]|nr:hypothetical protein M3Y97_00491200 [Aphelenchoides bicaudatus]
MTKLLLVQHFSLLLTFLVNSNVNSIASDRFGCDVMDPECREQISRNAFGNERPRSAPNRCNYQDLWLIPGRADASCTRPNAKRLVEIDPRQVKITPPLIRFPGCFTIEIKNLHILQNSEQETSFFAKSEYQWLNVKQFSELKCQNASSEGCGGFGNNCYYCDVCESLRDIDEAKTGESSVSSFASQLRGLHCPQRSGYFTFRKEFCFNDWAAFDADGDCQLDFLQTSEKSDLKSALASLQQIGYGTIVAKVRLAFNATGNIARKRALKEAQIERMVASELEERRNTWDINKGQFDKFQQWYVDYRKNIWHREEYLPWLLYENEISCLRLTFDVCERPPHRKPYGNQGYTCD